MFRQSPLPSNSVSRAQSNSMQTILRPAAMPTWRSARQGPAPCTCQFKPRSAGHLFSNRSPAQHKGSSWNCLHPQKQHHVLAMARTAPHAAGNAPQIFTEDDIIDVDAESHQGPLIPVTVSSGYSLCGLTAVWRCLYMAWTQCGQGFMGAEVPEGLLSAL